MEDNYYEHETTGEEQEYEEPEEESGEVEEPEIIEEESGDESISLEREDDDEEEEDDVPKNRGRVPGNARIQQIQREKYQALNELNRIAQENEYLKRLAVETSSKAEQLGDAAMIHYDRNANLRLEQAKDRKFKAHEEGDIQAEIEADVAIANAANELQEISKWKTNQEHILKRQYQQEQYQQQQQSSVPQGPDPQIAYDWLAQNSWYNQESHDFDPDLTQAARDYSETLENYYYRNGRPDLIMSQEYFNEIGNHIRSLQSQRGQGMSKKQLNMRPVRGGAAPVRGTPSQSSRRSERHQLSREEREIASVMGIKEKDYLSQKIKDMNDYPERWTNGGRGAYGKR